jgi:hypothetical protein
MQSSKKRQPTESPRKIQTEMTSFTGKRVDSKNSPPRSYAQVAAANRYEALSDPEQEDEEMTEAQLSDDSDTTPKKDNAQPSSTITKEAALNPLSKKSQRKLMKTAKKDVKKTVTSKNRLLSSATKATLERARKAKEALQSTLETTQDEKEDTSDFSILDNPISQENEEVDSEAQEERSEEVLTQENSRHPGPDKVATDSLTGNISGPSNNEHRNMPCQLQVGSKSKNPYTKAKVPQTQGILHALPQRASNTKKATPAGSIDKQISLKKGMLRPHIHRYTLRIKIIKSKTEEEEQVLVQKTLKKFFDIVLQGDSKSIIPPYFDLDRSDNSIPDLSSTFNVSALDSYYSLKRYFSRLSSRSEEGFVWSSIILAQSLPFATFMEKTRHSLDNQAFSLWPKASDHELAADVGWLLYSTRQQDEERMAELISSLVGEKIGIKWKAIRTTDGINRSKDKDNNSSRVYALHLECAADRAQEARQKLSRWYGSASKRFPDDTKMRLVPPFNTILSSGNRQKYASLIARQSALNSRLGSGTTWEFSTNLMIDRPEPSSGLSLRQILMAIPSQVFPHTPLFHTIDKQWRSENGVTFTFLPENESDARSLIAGLIPFLRHTADPWYMKMFTTEAKLRHSSSKWDQETRQVFSVEEYEIDEFLADDDEYNKTDEPTAERPIRNTAQDDSHILIQVPIIIDPEESPKIYEDTDSVSTFRPNDPSPASISPSKSFTPKIVSNPPSVLASSTSASKPTDINYEDEGESVSKLSDSQSRISSMERDMKQLQTSFQHALEEMKLQSQQHAMKQSTNDATLLEILSLLKHHKVSTPTVENNLGSSARDNQPEQLYPTGGSNGAAGTG